MTKLTAVERRSQISQVSRISWVSSKVIFGHKAINLGNPKRKWMRRCAGQSLRRSHLYSNKNCQPETIQTNIRIGVGIAPNASAASSFNLVDPQLHMISLKISHTSERRLPCRYRIVYPEPT
jgi:hypothetical protein